MKTKKKLKLAKIISLAAMVGFLAAAFGMYFLEVYYATIAFVALEIVAAVVMVVVFRMSCKVCTYLSKELVLLSGINGVSVTYDGQKYFMKREEKGSYNSVYACTLNDGTRVQAMISSAKKIEGVKVNGSLLSN